MLASAKIDNSKFYELSLSNSASISENKSTACCNMMYA